jgi:hypothetical protein
VTDETRVGREASDQCPHPAQAQRGVPQVDAVEAEKVSLEMLEAAFDQLPEADDSGTDSNP